MLSSGGENISESPGIVVGALVPVIGEALVAVLVHKLVVLVSGVGEEALKDLRSQDTSGMLSRVVSQQLVREHVRPERECNTRICRREAVQSRSQHFLFQMSLKSK